MLFIAIVIGYASYLYINFDENFSQQPTSLNELTKVIQHQKIAFDDNVYKYIQRKISYMNDKFEKSSRLLQELKSTMSIDDYTHGKNVLIKLEQDLLTPIVKEYNKIPNQGIKPFLFALEFQSNLLTESIETK